MNRVRLWEWSWGVSQQAAGTLLAAGVIYVASVVAGVLTFHLALILAPAFLGVAIGGFAVYAASKVRALADTSAQLELLRQMREAGKINDEELRKILKNDDDD